MRASFTAAALCLTFSTAALADPETAFTLAPSTPPARDSIISFQIGAGQIGSVGVSYERAFRKNWSFAVQGNLLGRWDHSDFVTSTLAADGEPLQATTTSTLGLGAMVGVHWFPLGAAPDGLWIGPAVFGNFTRTQFSYSDPSVDKDFGSVGHSLQWGAQGMLGYNFVTTNRFTASVSVNAGIGFSSQRANGVSGFSINSQSFVFGSQVGLGWIF